MRVLASISTRGRYYTTLPLAIESVIMQTRHIDKLVIFDDNDEPGDVRNNFIYQRLFEMLNLKQISWEWLFAGKKGQHHNHEIANNMGFDFVWRVDDDVIAEPNVLENLLSHITDKVGAVGGSVLTPPIVTDTSGITGKIENIDKEPNIQWGPISQVRSVDHLHCTFLYRAGKHNYNLNLSRVAHREETLFTYGLKQKGYELLVVPNAISWHLKDPQGGIRHETTREMFEHDDLIFQDMIKVPKQTVVVLDCGMGDHIVFKHILPEIKNPVIFTCYPEIVPGGSIAEAQALLGNIDQYNIYKAMDQWNWQGSLEDAFRKMYLK